MDETPTPVGFPVSGRIFVHAASVDDCVTAVTTNSALEAHGEGKTVVVPTVEMARQMLIRLGVDDETIQQRIRFVQARLRLNGIMHL